MTEPTTGEQKPTEEATDTSLSEAVRIVRKAVDAEEKRLRQIADGQECEPVFLYGETPTGYEVEIRVEPAKVAQIMLDYWYPLYKVLAEDAPQEMWNELAKMAGLNYVYSVDL